MGTMLLVAAVFAATGCTSPGSPAAISASTASSAAGPSSTPEPLLSTSAPSTAAPSSGATASSLPTDAPTAPAQAQQPQPAPEPTFAPPEQNYLASRVPEGTDPNSVLQAGQEVCAQLEAAKAVDPKAVVSQLIEKNDADSAAAVANLCPGLKPELDAAGRGFTDGEYGIGEAAPKEGKGTISSGTYQAWNPSGSCQLTAFDAAGKALAQSNGKSPVTIPAGTASVVSVGCYTWLAA